MSDLSKFNFDYKLKPFSSLSATFWESLQLIGKKHQIVCSNILKAQSGENNSSENKDILNKTLALKTLIQSDMRYYYFEFLKYNFILSQPHTMGQIKKNFKNKIFPYYLFTLITKKKEIHYMIIDFIEKKINIYYKDKKLVSILKDKIASLMKENNNSIIITLNDNQITNDKKKNIEITPEFNIQSELIYMLISFMMQSGGKKENTDFSLLEDDTYIPNGILLKGYILKSHQKKMLSKDRRYAVLGPSQIIIFKDNSMKEIRNIIPLIPFGTQLNSDDKENILTFTFFKRKQEMQFLDNNNYDKWKNILKDIFNKKIEEKIDGINLYKLKEKELQSKVIDLINKDIADINEKIKSENNELEESKKEILNII